MEIINYNNDSNELRFEYILHDDNAVAKGFGLMPELCIVVKKCSLWYELKRSLERDIGSTPSLSRM